MDTSLTLLAQNLSAYSPSHLRRLEFLVDASPLVFYTCEATGDMRVTFVSEGVKAVWGYGSEEFLADGKFWVSRLHPDDVARVFAGLEYLTQAGEYSHEYRFRHKSGEYRWLRDQCRLLRDPAGNPLEIVGHCFDITERKLAEAALRESEARLQLIFNGTSDLQVLFRVEPAGGFVTETINRAVIENFHSHTGKDMRDFLGRPFEELLAALGLTPEEIEHRRALYLRAIQERATVHFEPTLTALRAAAEVAVSPVVDQNGRCTHVLWNARDVSERVKAANALFESEERYALATQATLDGIFDWNLATGDSHLSPRLKEILGFLDGELANDFSAFFGRVHPDDVNWLSQLVGSLNAGRSLEKFDHEVRLRRKDGSYCCVVSRGLVVRDAQGRPARLIGAIRDITERKQAEDASAFLAAIVQSSDDSIVGSDLDGVILSWNASSQRFWGYSAEEAIGQSNRILFRPGQQQEFDEKIASIRRGELTDRYETVRVRKNGTLVPVSVVLSPVKDTRGKLLGFAAIYSDMTERNEAEARLLAAKQAAEASAALLRESEERYELVTQATRDAIFDSDLVTGIAYHSPRLNEILGYSADQMPTGPSWFLDHVHPHDRPRLRDGIARDHADKSVHSFDYEVRVLCQDGSYRWVATNGLLLRDATGQPTRVIGALRDITERRQAEEKLAASEKRLRDILDSLYGFVGLYTLDGVLIDINRAALLAAGLKPEDVLGKPIWETAWMAHSVEEQERMRAIIARAATGEVLREETTALVAGGQQIVIDSTFGPLYDRHGVIVNVIGSGVDVTARKEVESKLVVAKQVAEIASRAKSEFLANMSHEIRTPMNGIIGLTEVVLESDLNPEQREYLSLVKSSASTLMQIIGDILDISKIQAGKMVLRPKEFWVRDLISSTIGAFLQAAREKNLRLEYSVHPAIPEVLLGDAALLKRVLEKLVGNAIKFTAAGAVNLAVGISPENFEKLHFEVSDTGIGIAADQQRRIFEPFTQVDASSRREYGGTGLGLAISAQLVEMMGGEIWVVSDGRNGSVFHFTAVLAPVAS